MRMQYIEYKEGIIICNGSRVSRDIENTIFNLSVKNGKCINETCDLLNQFMQKLEKIVAESVEKLWKLSKELAEIFAANIKNIREPRKNRKTRYGSRTVKPKKSLVNIKWREKYRPP